MRQMELSSSEQLRASSAGHSIIASRPVSGMSGMPGSAPGQQLPRYGGREESFTPLSDSVASWNALKRHAAETEGHAAVVYESSSAHSVVEESRVHGIGRDHDTIAARRYDQNFEPQTSGTEGALPSTLSLIVLCRLATYVEESVYVL